MDNKIETLKKWIAESDRIAFFGGAGVSTESGIPDFRSANGLYSEKLNMNLSPEQLVSHTAFVRYPEEFFEFYKNKLISLEAKPNDAHKALAKLEDMGKLTGVITQNIDGLHQMAGSKKVFELHGSVHRNYCVKCKAFYDAEFMVKAEGVPKCTKCGSMIKPDVVLYEESLNSDVMSGAIDAIQKADLMIIGGTSLVVYPAAGLVNYFHGKHIVLINKSTTSMDSRADLVINDAIGAVLKQVV